MISFRRRMMMFVRPEETVIPYDARVEYLESSGTQRIALGITGNMKFEVVAQASSASTSTKILLCSTENNAASTWFGTANGYWGVGTNSGQYTSVSDVTKATIEVTFTSRTSVAGTVNEESFSRTTSNYNSNWTLFATSKQAYSFSGKVFSLKAYKNNNLVLDLIPVRKDGVGYMYDILSGTLLGNSGSGDFSYGNDVTT